MRLCPEQVCRSLSTGHLRTQARTEQNTQVGVKALLQPFVWIGLSGKIEVGALGGTFCVKNWSGRSYHFTR